MSGISDPMTKKVLALNEEEVLMLLQMCTLTLAGEEPSQGDLLSRLSSLYREFLRDPLPSAVLLPDSILQSSYAPTSRELSLQSVF